MKYWKQVMIDKPELKEISGKHGTKLEPMFYDSETSKESEFVTVGKGKKKKSVEKVKDTWVYLWMCSFGDYLYYGRYLHEFFEFLEWIIQNYELSETRKIDIWVHNLSYDISYMYELLFRLNGGKEGISMLCSAPRKFISYTIEQYGITLKCTYRLTNRSLDKWCKDLGVKHKKQTGTKGYNTTYKPWDKLPQNEYKYGAYDIISLKECFYKECEIQGYDFKTIPLTQTGFVRKDFQAEFTDKGHYKENKANFNRTRLTNEQYKRLLRASGGGMVQGNYKILGRTVYEENGIGHVDFESHYPTQLRCNPLAWQPNTLNIPHLKFQDLDLYEFHFGYYYVVDVVLGDIEIHDEVTAPFLCESKCTKGPNTNIYSINGKVIKIDGEVRICCTNFDLDIFREQYKITWYKIIDVDIYTAETLPPYIMDVIDKYYVAKSETKAKLKKDPHNEDLLAQYNGVDKPKLNGIYGCCDTKPIRPEISLNEDFEFVIDNSGDLWDYYKRYNSCMPFQVGVFTTALGRYELYKITRDVIGYDAFLYSDTDSEFFRNSPEIEKRIADYRTECRRDSEENGFFVTLSDGTRKYYHDLSPEDDHLKSKTFRVLHAKCYALEPDGKLKCTIAGVSSKSADGTITREQELGSLDEFKPGKTFKACGGTRADYSTIRSYAGYSGGGCAILETEKTLGATFDDEIEGEEIYE